MYVVVLYTWCYLHTIFSILFRTSFVQGSLGMPAAMVAMWSQPSRTSHPWKGLIRRKPILTQPRYNGLNHFYVSDIEVGIDLLMLLPEQMETLFAK